MQVYDKKINLKLKIRKKRRYHEKKDAHWHTVNSMLLKPVKQRLTSHHFVQTLGYDLFSIFYVQAHYKFPLFFRIIWLV
jgi:hypothetical protein